MPPFPSIKPARTTLLQPSSPLQRHSWKYEDRSLTQGNQPRVLKKGGPKIFTDTDSHQQPPHRHASKNWFLHYQFFFWDSKDWFVPVLYPFFFFSSFLFSWVVTSSVRPSTLVINPTPVKRHRVPASLKEYQPLPYPKVLTSPKAPWLLTALNPKATKLTVLLVTPSTTQSVCSEFFYFLFFLPFLSSGCH